MLGLTAPEICTDFPPFVRVVFRVTRKRVKRLTELCRRPKGPDCIWERKGALEEVMAGVGARQKRGDNEGK